MRIRKERNRNSEAICYICKKPYKIEQYFIDFNAKKGYKNYCSKECHRQGQMTSPLIKVNCAQCGKELQKQIHQINDKRKKTSNCFCSRVCFGIYNSSHKTHGYRRSKLEKWLEIQLKQLYPNIEILYNNRTVINSELDIYIPSFKLAIELNGIFHYEPIYGKEQLEKIKNNDTRKFQACLEKGIEMCIIDTSKHTYVKPKTSQKYLDIIVEIINKKLSQNPNILLAASTILAEDSTYL